MAGLGPGRSRGTTAAGATGGGHSQQQQLWSCYSARLHERPSAVVLQSICTHEPLRSIALAPAVEQDPQQQQTHCRPSAYVPLQQHHQQWQQQQQRLEQLMHLGPTAQLQQQQQQQQQQEKEDKDALPPPLQQLFAAARWGSPLCPAELLALVPLLPTLRARRLSQTAEALSLLQPDGAAVAAATPGLHTALLAAAADLFSAGRMGEWASYTLLQALVKLGVQPPASWLADACAGMQVSSWRGSRALATVAACLPQLGHVPSSSWAATYWEATGSKLQELPPVSLARMLHGVVAWRHLQQQQQQVEQGAASGVGCFPLVPPQQWLCGVLQQLHSCSSALKPCEVAMVLQALQRLQSPGFVGADSTCSGGDYVQQQQQSVLQPSSLLNVAVQQLQHVLVPAVAQQRQEFSSLDFAVVLHSLALLQQQQLHGQGQAGGGHVEEQPPQRQQQLCSWDWLQQVLPSVQDCLPAANPRTQATSLWAVAVLLQPYLQQQAQHQQQQQRQQQQQEYAQQQQQQGQGQQQAPTMSAAAAAARAASQRELQRRGSEPGLTRPAWHISKQQQPQQLSELLAALEVGTATSAAASQAQQAAPGSTTASATPPQPAAAATDASSLFSRLLSPAAPAATTATPSSAPADTAPSPPDAAGMLMAWLDCFYAASLPQLHTFSTEDLVVTACTLATQQQVPPVAWYEQLLEAVQQQLGGVSPPHNNHSSVCVGQVSGLAWALGRMALLPCRHNPGASLVPLQPWFQTLYVHTGLLLAGGQESGEEASAPGLQAPGQAAAASGVSGSRRLPSSAEVVRLMWAAAVCDYDPGDEWWAAAEQQLLAPAHASNAGVGRPAGAGADAATTPTPQQQREEEEGLVVEVTEQYQPALSHLPVRLLGALLQAYAAANRPLLPQLLQHAIINLAVADQLCAEPIVNTLRLLRGLQHTGCSIGQQWLQQLALGMQERLMLLRPGELLQLLTCLADAGLQVQQGLDAAAAAAAVPVVAGAGGDANSSSSTSTINNRLAGTGWTAAVAKACQQHVSSLSAQDVSRLLWAAAKLRLALPGGCVQALLQRLQLCFLDAPPSALAVAIDATTRLGVLPSRDWLGSFFMATHRTFTTTAAAAASGATTSSRSSDSAGSDEDSSSSSVRSAVSSVRAGLVLVAAILQTLQGLARLRAALPAKWLKQQLLLLHGQLPLLQPRHVAILLLLLARLKTRPSPMYLHSMLRQLGDCRECSALDLVHIAYGFASLRWQPNRQWMQLFLAASASKLHLMSNQGLALMHWALAITRVAPPAATWRRVAVTVVAGRLDQLDARQLSMIVWAWGRLQVHLTPPFVYPEVRGGRDSKQQQQESGQLQDVASLEVQEAASGADISSSETSTAGAASSSSISSPEQDAAAARRRGVWQQRMRLAEQLLVAAMAQRGEFSATGLTHLLAGLAKMQVYPSQAWLHAMVSKGSSQPLSVLDGYQMQQLLWALARLRYRAPAGWVDDMGVLLETRWQHHASTRYSAEWGLDQLQKLAHRE